MPTGSDTEAVPFAANVTGRIAVRTIGALLLVVASVAEALILVAVGAANVFASGDIIPAPVVGGWPVPAGVALCVLGLAGIKSERAAAAAAAVAILPLLLALSLLREGQAALGFAAVVGGAAALTIVGAALRIRGTGSGAGS